MMLSEEYAYTFACLLLGLRDGRCLETLWRLEVLLNWFWDLVEGISVFVEVCWYRVFGGTDYASGPFWPLSTWIVSNNLAIGTEQLRDRYFFCIWRGRLIFYEFPLEWGSIFGFEKVIFENWNRFMEIIRYMCEILATSLYMPENSRTRIWNFFEGEMFLVNESLFGWFRKEHPGYFKAREKKGTRKLLKRWETDRLTVVKSWRKRGNIFLGLIMSYA